MSAIEAPLPYPAAVPKPDFPAIEREVLARWERERTFARSIEERPGGDNEYVFYDGPPFANGLPHYGHLLTGYVKDVVPRYQTMRGRRVERRFGWDCHGLPAEMEAEKELGVSGRKAIHEYGIDRFNAACRTSVLKYTSAWQRYVTRMGRWVDFENDYKTLDLSYMESVMWAFQQLWKQGLVYEGYRVMPYSWAAQTPLSNFEIRLDDATRPKQDPAVTVALRLQPQPGDPGPIDLLVWTTTPWTLPSNLGAAVGAEMTYALTRLGGRIVCLAEDALPRYAKELGDAERVGTWRGRDLVGRSYEPLFPWFADRRHAHRVLDAAFVTTGEGTGIVHLAPYGEDDQQVLEAHGVVLVDPVDEEGRFTQPVSDYVGQHVFDANKAIIRDLKERGVLLKHETIVHNYPHCWRTDTPIIYKPLRSWYVQVTAIRERMLELNRSIRWIPEHVRDGQFGRWLEGARDWSISRNRFWGSPIPVWKSDDPAFPRVDVYGSLEELERDFGVRLTDLHRPAVDALTRPNPDDPTGRSTMRRVPEVLDCWFESGAMPFAQVHYPFENRAWFEEHFPADFIVEYLAQTRGWFYTLMVLATALFDKPPFRNCIGHGIVLDTDGRKLSKRLRNYPDPEEVFEKIGSDALRWYLMASPVLRGGDLKVDKQGAGIAEVVRLVINPIWNAFTFFTMYANADRIRARVRTDSTALIDRYALAKTRALVDAVTERMDAYDLAGACGEITAFLDALNNWVIRRGRSRFWEAGDSPDKRDAYDTLYTVLTTLTRVAAPFLPFVTERIHRDLTGDESVHLADWPDAASLPADPELVRDMDRVRDVCSVALMLREERGLRARLPLATLTLAGRDAARIAPYAHLVRDEVNVKEVALTDDFDAVATRQLVPDGRVLGPRLGASFKAVAAAARSGAWEETEDGGVRVGGTELLPGEFLVRVQVREGVVAGALRTNDAVVVLDDRVTPELRAEGIARDVVRLVQSARKDADLDISDSIDIAFDLGPEVEAAVRAHEDFLRDQVLAGSVAYGEVFADGHRFTGATEGMDVVGALRVVRDPSKRR